MAELDPRFDPQFQRGFDPAVHAPRTRPRPPVVEPAETPGEHPAISEDSVAGVSTGSTTGAGSTTGVSTGSTTGAGSTTDDEVEPRPRNPYRLILLLVSLAAIAGAGVLLWRRIEQDPYGGYGGYGGDTAHVFVQQFTDSLLVPLLTGGVLGLCLWLALGALRRRDDG